MDRSLKFLNWDDDKFHGTVSEAARSLESDLAAMEKHSDVTIRCVGHTHIDVAWLWRLNHTREKAMRSFSTVLHLSLIHILHPPFRFCCVSAEYESPAWPSEPKPQRSGW